jgi:hypothetical protein
MAASDFYWSRVPGFGKMWFLLLPRNAKSSAGGSSLIGSVVRDHQNGILGTGIFGANYPEPNHLTTAQIILKALEANRTAIGISAGEELIKEDTFPGGLTIEVEKRDALKLDVAGFPSLPASFTIDYARMHKVTIAFGSGTVKRIIPEAYLSKLKIFYNGDDSRVPGSDGIDISKETIVHQILLTKQYTVTFESLEEFKTQTEVAIKTANIANAGKIKFSMDATTKKKISVEVDDGNEYLIALNHIDWDQL